MQITIGPYDPNTRRVSVTYVDQGVTHEREVNACHDADGAYDPAATASRVADVGLGVAHKIALGVISNAPPGPELPPVEQPEG